MPDNLPEILRNTLPQLNVQQDDSVTIKYSAGFAKATVKKNNGETMTQRLYSQNGYQSQTFTAFNPDQMDKTELINLVKDMKKRNPKTSQAEIAEDLGISQSTVSNYLKK